jgi:hypothetical protein
MLDLFLTDTQPSDDEAYGDIERFVDRAWRFYHLCGQTGQAVLDHDELIQVADISLTFIKNYKEPSWFKNVAVFTLAVASRKPFRTPLTEEFEFIRLENNAVIAIMESLYWLNGAELMTNEGKKKIENPINFSDHFFKEFVQAVSVAAQNFQGNYQDTNDKSKACLLALMYESLAYRDNDHIPYPDHRITDCAARYFLQPLSRSALEIKYGSKIVRDPPPSAT